MYPDDRHQHHPSGLGEQMSVKGVHFTPVHRCTKGTHRSHTQELRHRGLATSEQQGSSRDSMHMEADGRPGYVSQILGMYQGQDIALPSVLNSQRVNPGVCKNPRDGRAGQS